MTTSTRHPEIDVQLTGLDGNVFVLIGACTKAMRRARVDKAEIDEFVHEVTDAPSYDAALQCMMQWVNVS